MSRNISGTECEQCDVKESVAITGQLFFYEERFQDMPESWMQHFKGTVMADATCQYCDTKYIAWIKPSPNYHGYRETENDRGFYDLSYRSSFNDEPGKDDIPQPKPPSPIELKQMYIKLLEGKELV